MNEPGNTFDGPVDSASQESGGELQSLRTLLAAALILLIVFSACVDYYLSTQSSEMNRLLFVDRQTINNFPAYSARAGDFWSKLVEYSKSHPDFNPVIEKWKGTISIHTNAPPPKAK
ncbi:MAG TPA: hypothetical protein VFC07_08770 [Verrucomicrobiae bacterium]|nr:hypothetical protein [Verrucomicrobiae bacterium]